MAQALHNPADSEVLQSHARMTLQKGQYLYFTASTDVGPTTGWLDLSSAGHMTSRSAYLMVLRKDLPSPLAPEC